MFIAKYNDLIILARETRDKLENDIKDMVYDSIEETQEDYQLYQIMGQYLTTEQIQQKERERISMLSLTAADVERAIYKAKGMDFDDVIAAVEAAMDAAASAAEGISGVVDKFVIANPEEGTQKMLKLNAFDKN